MLLCLSAFLRCKSQPICHAAPEKRWAASTRLNLQICSCKFSYEFCLCSVWVLVDHVYQKKLENWRIGSTIHPFSLSICTVVLATCCPIGYATLTHRAAKQLPASSISGVTQSRRDGPCGHEEDWAHYHVLVWTCRLKHALDSRLETAWNSNYLRLLPTCRFSFSSYWYWVSSRISKYSFPHTYAVYSDLPLSIDLYE